MGLQRQSCRRSALRALVTGGVLLACSPATAMAHAYLESSSPAAGAREESAPAEVRMGFDEPLNRPLSTAAIYNSQTERRVSASVSFPAPLEMVLRPAQKLARGSYRVEWHSVSTLDGHELEGSFSFGVQAAAIGGANTTRSGPLAGLGWLRVLVSTAMYAALFVFAGALLLRTVRGGPGHRLWVLPGSVRARLGDRRAAELERSERRLVLDAGLAAVALAAASALIETQIAGGNLSGPSIHAFLLSNTTGLARVWFVLLLAVALSGALIGARGAGAVTALALGALALSGHADSASPRVLSITVDWLHLIAGAIWLGGIATIALLWLPRLRGAGRELRRAVMSEVLPRFGRVALPAFVLVALTGAVDAYIQVRHPSLLWETPYGRVLLVKSALVVTIALMSYAHAFRLRPSLLAANPHPDARLERRHWRLIGTEPLVGIALAVTVALLASFPAPGQIAAARRALVAQPLAVCNPCVLPLPTANQLGVAGYSAAEADVVAAWLERRDGRLEGQVRVLGIEGQPASTPFEIVGATAVSPACGLACRTFTIPYTPATLSVILNPDRQERTVTLPARWQRPGDARARRILDRAQASMRGLSSLRDNQLVQSVPGKAALTRYILHTSNRVAWSTSLLRAGRQAQFSDAEVQIGARQYSRTAEAPRWQQEPARDTLPLSVPTWFTWTDNAEMTRLLGTRRTPVGPVATIALMDPGAPIWQTLQIDLAGRRVLSSRLITPGYSETDHYRRFDSAPPIVTPRPYGGPGA